MIVDSSALVAILRGEPEEAEFKKLVAENVTRISAATALATAIVVTADRHRQLDELVADAEITVVPFDSAHAQLAREAYARFGKVPGSKARLTFGDCMAYALAMATGEPLLFKGDGFSHTDITPAR